MPVNPLFRILIPMWNLRLAAVLLLPLGSYAQGPSSARPDILKILKYTAKNPYSRFEDGRPRVPDELLNRIRELSSEEIWTALVQTRVRYDIACARPHRFSRSGSGSERRVPLF